jgi:hypothetical protein
MPAKIASEIPLEARPSSRAHLSKPEVRDKPYYLQTSLAFSGRKIAWKCPPAVSRRRDPLRALGRPKILSSFVQSPCPGQKHACHQNAERDVIESVRENVHDSRPIAFTLARKRAIFWWTFPHSVKRPRHRRGKQAKNMVTRPALSRLCLRLIAPFT